MANDQSRDCGGFSGGEPAEERNADLLERFIEVCALYALSKKLSDSLDIDEVFDDLESFLKDLLDIDDFSIMLFDDRKESLVVWKPSGDQLGHTVGVMFKAGEGVCGRVAGSGEPALVGDLSMGAGFVEGERIGPGVGAFFSTPLVIGEEVVGALNVYKATPNSINVSEMRLFNQTAAHIAKALEHSRMFQKARMLSITDELAKLYSRRYFFEALDREFVKAQRNESPLSVIMFDIDSFKTINDSQGHVAGDEIIKKVGAILKSNTRGSDVAARYGGDEFALLLPDTDLIDAVTLAEKLRAIAEEQLSVRLEDGQDLTTTLSSGVASYPSCAASRDDLILTADKFLMQGKKLGKNTVVSSVDFMQQEPLSERRAVTRHAVKINIDPAQGGYSLVDINVDNLWLTINLEDVSERGFKGSLDSSLAVGDTYRCRTNPVSGVETVNDFLINCVWGNRSRPGGYTMGARVIDNLAGWKSAVQRII